MNEEHSCVKCGSTNTKFRFVEQYKTFFPGRPDTFVSEEHLLYTCISCGYEWTGPTKDAPP